MRSTLLSIGKYISDKDTLLTLAKGGGAITGMEGVDELAQVVPETNIMIGQIPLKEIL